MIFMVCRSRLSMMSFSKFLSRWATCLSVSQLVSQLVNVFLQLLRYSIMIYLISVVKISSCWVQFSYWQLTRASCSCSRSQIPILFLLVIKFCMHSLLSLILLYLLPFFFPLLSRSHSSLHFNPYSFFISTQLNFILSSYSHPSHMLSSNSHLPTSMYHSTALKAFIPNTTGSTVLVHSDLSLKTTSLQCNHRNLRHS